MRDRRHVTEQDDHVVWLEHEVVHHILHPTEGARRPRVLHPKHVNRDFAFLKRFDAVTPDIGHQVTTQCIPAQAGHGVYHNWTAAIRCELEQVSAPSNLTASDVQEAIAALSRTKREPLIQHTTRCAEAHVE
jgi:hypothetical protein